MKYPHQIILMLTALPMILLACSSNNNTSSADGQQSARNIVWEACEPVPTLECGSMEVPIDYAMPDGDTLNLALVRKPASSTIRRGFLVINPGGPGEPGTDVIYGVEGSEGLGPAVLYEYDLISFDPRGTGGSAPIDCSEFIPTDRIVYPTTRSDLNKFYSDSTALASACHEKYGDYLLHIGSNNVVRDMEEMRKALHQENPLDDKMNFFGQSYGTRLASLYLQNYPEHSGRMVLDAAVPPTPNLLAQGVDMLPVLQRLMNNLLAQCTDIDPDCNPDDLATTLQNRIDFLLENNLEEEFQIYVLIAILAGQNPAFGQIALQPLMEYLATNDIQILSEFLEELTAQIGGDVTGGPDTKAKEAIMCADEPTRPTLDSMAPLLASYNAISNLYAEPQILSAASCAGWPEAINPIPEIATNQAPPSLVIGGTNDPNTPFIWSVQLTGAIGGALIRSQHLGHTIAFLGGSQCVDDIASQFLQDGVLPSDVDVCVVEE